MKPVLLLIPGMLNTADVWARVTPLLQNAADLRIADVTTQSSIAEMARDAWALVADLPASTPLVLCGFSMGGYVAIEMLANSARGIKGLALLDTSGRPESPEGEVNRAKTIAAFERNFPKVVETMLPYSTHPGHHQDMALFDALRALMLPVGSATAVRQTRAVAARSDHRGMLAKLQIPVVVLCGRADQVTPPALSEELAALIPTARLQWLERSGHMTPMEQPEQVAQAIRSIL